MTMQITPLSDEQVHVGEEASSAQNALKSGIEEASSAQNALKSGIEEQVQRYTSWLATQAQRPQDAVQQERMNYAERSSRIVEVDERRIRTFAPFRYKYSALQTITPKQCLTVGVGALLFVLACIWNWQFAVTGLLSLVTLLYLGYLVLDVVLAGAAVRQPAEENIDDAVIHALKDAAWPGYTILCPLYREAQVVPQFVKAMQELDYPHEKLQILFLTEEDDSETRTAIQAMRLPRHFQIVTVPDGSPRTKPRACNYGLMEATGQYVVIYDAEDVPDPLQLKKAVLTFANHGADLACVQAKLNFYNADQNLLTRWFTAEYSLWFDLILPGLQRLGLAIPLGGTSNHFPTQTLRALGGWDAFNVTEDCDLGLRLSWFRLSTVVLNSTTYEEANSSFKNWIRQRSRWIKGYMQTYLVHMREPLHYLRQKRYREFFSLQFVVGGKSAVLLINPLLWLLLAFSFGLRLFGQHPFGALLPAPLVGVGAISLLLGNFFYGYTYLLGCMKREQYHLVKWMLLIPLYWVMASIASYMALYQLITKPHYWEKTIHGLHLQQEDVHVPVFAADVLSKVEELNYVPLPITLQETPVQKYAHLAAVPVSSVENTLQEMIAPRKPAFSATERAALRQSHGSQRFDLWFFLTLCVASIASVLTSRYYYLHHMLLRTLDASTSLNVGHNLARSGDVTQLGNTLLPLPRLAMLPFGWNEEMWRSGLAGSVQAMLCYVLASLFFFQLLRRITKNSPVSFVGSLLFILNPFVLSLQSTPLGTIMALATLLASCYYLVAWMQEEQLANLLRAAACVCLATLTSYVGWAFFLLCLLILPLIGLLKRQHRSQIESTFVVFALFAGLGIGLWLLWNLHLTGSPLAFLPFLAQYKPLLP